jgi:hypothetical protein
MELRGIFGQGDRLDLGSADIDPDAHDLRLLFWCVRPRALTHLRIMAWCASGRPKTILTKVTKI